MMCFLLQRIIPKQGSKSFFTCSYSILLKCKEKKDYIVRSKLYPTDRKVGSYRCGNSRCQLCTSIQVTDTFSNFVPKSAYKINHKFNCNSKSLIYSLTCKTCGKQYTGKTVDKFRSRWNNYKTGARKAASSNIESCKRHFFQNHFLQD